MFVAYLKKRWIAKVRVASCELRVEHLKCELTLKVRVASCFWTFRVRVDIKSASCELLFASCELRVTFCELLFCNSQLVTRNSHFWCSTRTLGVQLAPLDFNSHFWISTRTFGFQLALLDFKNIFYLVSKNRSLLNKGPEAPYALNWKHST